MANVILFNANSGAEEIFRKVKKTDKGVEGSEVVVIKSGKSIEVSATDAKSIKEVYPFMMEHKDFEAHEEAKTRREKFQSMGSQELANKQNAEMAASLKEANERIAALEELIKKTAKAE